METNLRRQILELYEAVDAQIAEARPVCIASGRCCRFKEYGHTLFLSNLEAEILLDSAPPYERPVSESFCPFQKEKLCTTRDLRPLGCRIYFCDPAFHDAQETLSEKYVRRLKSLADEHNVPWQYAPLHQFLNSPGNEETGRCG